MILEPIYAENIIVAVIYNNEFKWYVTDKELWFLDYNKLDNECETLGIEVEDEYEADERKGIKVLNTENINIFLQRINKDIATKEELNCFLYKCIKNRTERDEILNYSPVLLVNFDDRILYSMFPEQASYEEYVPEDWKGKYEDFTELIPESQKYWIDEFNNNLFLK